MRVTSGKSRVRESRMPGSVRARPNGRATRPRPWPANALRILTRQLHGGFAIEFACVKNLSATISMSDEKATAPPPNLIQPELLMNRTYSEEHVIDELAKSHSLFVIVTAASLANIIWFSIQAWLRLCKIVGRQAAE